MLSKHPWVFENQSELLCKIPKLLYQSSLSLSRLNSARSGRFAGVGLSSGSQSPLQKNDQQMREAAESDETKSTRKVAERAEEEVVPEVKEELERLLAPLNFDLEGRYNDEGRTGRLGGGMIIRW